MRMRTLRYAGRLSSFLIPAITRASVGSPAVAKLAAMCPSRPTQIFVEILPRQFKWAFGGRPLVERMLAAAARRALGGEREISQFARFGNTC